MRDEFYFPSKDGNTEIHTIEWKPEKEVKAVLQICHGMVEYIGRYDEFAQFLCDKGYYVVGNDHLGHGKSVQAKSEYGFFNEKYGNVCVLGDIHTLRQRTEKKYPDVPYFMMGHSMGSSLLRQYIQMYGKGLDGAVLMGTVADHKKALTADSEKESVTYIFIQIFVVYDMESMTLEYFFQTGRTTCIFTGIFHKIQFSFTCSLIHGGQCILCRMSNSRRKCVYDSERTADIICLRSGRSGG